MPRKSLSGGLRLGHLVCADVPWIQTYSRDVLPVAGRARPALGVTPLSRLIDLVAPVEKFDIGTRVATCWSDVADPAVQVLVIVPVDEGAPLLSSMSRVGERARVCSARIAGWCRAIARVSEELGTRSGQERPATRLYGKVCKRVWGCSRGGRRVLQHGHGHGHGHAHGNAQTLHANNAMSRGRDRGVAACLPRLFDG